MDINEKLKDAFVVTQFTDKEKLKKELSNWSNSIPNSPIKNLGNIVEITNASIKEFYILKLDSFVEIRELQSLTRPFYGMAPTEQTIFSRNQVDVWAENIQMPKLFSNLEKNITVHGSERVYDCRKCSAKGEIKCYKCRGQGKYRCSGCGGSGQIKCSSCEGRGEKQCPSGCYLSNGWQNGQVGKKRCFTCGGRMYVPCNSCVHGFKNCSTCGTTGQEICSNCGGSGSVTCDTCLGRQKLEDYLNINVKFVTMTYQEILNENNLPDTFIKDLVKDDDYINSPYFRTEMTFLEESFSDSIQNEIFKTEFISLQKKFHNELNEITQHRTNSYKIHKQRFSIYKIENLVEVIYYYKEKKYSNYFYNNFNNSFSDQNPIKEITDSFIENANKLFTNKKYSQAYTEILKALNIFPADEKYLSLKKKIVEKANKQYTTTLILAFFQLDRFYTGKHLLGVLKICTLGGFMIWYILDIVFLLTGKYKDSNDNIVKKLE
jgi:hypothetical protein